MGVDGRTGTRDGVDRLSIRELEKGSGLRIDDRIERRHCEVTTGGPVDPVELLDDPFRYPVDTSVQISTDELTFDGFSRTFVHVGGSVAEVGHFDARTFESGRYELELSGPVKLYVDVAGPMTVETAVTEVSVDLETTTDVRIGARSYHERPAATVTTTPDPTDVMAAVSTFGSAMKTTRSERSYPTLRGHPPALEVGTELSIPRGIEPPQPEITIEVPPSLHEVMVVSPLAYYLGARVVPGTEPRLVVDGETVPLGAARSFEEAVERALKRTFLLDCVVRTTGPRSIPLYEREALDAELDVDLGDYYGQPGPERLLAYSSIPYETLEPYMPTWKLTAHVEPDPSSLAVLPFLAADLAVVRGPPDVGVGAEVSSDVFSDPRGTGGVSTGGSSDIASLQATPPSKWPDCDAEELVVELGPADSLEQAWVGRGTPVRASKAIPEAYRNRLDRSPRQEEIEIVVVCNDEAMLSERDDVEAVYGTREEFPVDVTFYEDLTTDRLALLLESDLDFFHYIGHVDEDGFRCADGKLDASTLESVSVDIFFLNACRSYQQGRRLIEKGAISGVVTLDEVIDSGAVRIGKTLAELLNYGFPLRSALDVARDRSIVGSQYLVVGDGNADVAQSQNGCALLADVTTVADGYELDITTYPATGSGMGTQFRPALQRVDQVFLSPGALPTVHLTAAELREYFSTSVFPVRVDGEFTWTDRVEVPEDPSL